MSEHRTVFVTLSPLLSDIISESVAPRLGLKLVGHIQARDTLSERLPVLDPEWVFIGLRAGETDTIGFSVLKVVPTAKVLAISDDARYAYLHEMRPTRLELLDFSVASLSAAISELDSSRER